MLYSYLKHCDATLRYFHAALSREAQQTHRLHCSSLLGLPYRTLYTERNFNGAFWKSVDKVERNPEPKRSYVSYAERALRRQKSLEPRCGDWVLVKRFNLSCQNKETILLIILFTIDPH